MLVGDNRDFIQWSLNQPDSHFSLEFFGCTVFHSSIHGTNVDEISHLLSSRKITHVEEIILPADVEMELYKRLVKKYSSKDYDWAYFWSLARLGFKHKILRQELSREVKIQSKSQLICHEALEAAREILVKMGYPDTIPELDFKRAATPTFLKEEYLKAIGEENG